MLYAALNTIRVLFCYAVMFAFMDLAYGKFFHWYMAPSLASVCVFSFVPLPRVRLRHRLPLLIASVIVARSHQAAWRWYFESVFDFLFWFGPHNMVFLLAYALLEGGLLSVFAAVRPAGRKG